MTVWPSSTVSSRNESPPQISAETTPVAGSMPVTSDRKSLGPAASAPAGAAPAVIRAAPVTSARTATGRARRSTTSIMPRSRRDRDLGRAGRLGEPVEARHHLEGPGAGHGQVVAVQLEVGRPGADRVADDRTD